MRPFLSKDEQKIRDAAFHVDATEQDKQLWKELKLSDETIRLHDETLIANWNKRVGKQDRVYHLGDFGFGKTQKIIEILDRLNGRIYMIFGNHDKSIRTLKDRFECTKDLYSVKIADQDALHGKQYIVMCHYAMITWNRIHHSAYMLFGHSHHSLTHIIDKFFPGHPMMDVGVDETAYRLAAGGPLRPEDYRPLSYWDDIKPILSKKKFVPIDHHGIEDEED